MRLLIFIAVIIGIAIVFGAVYGVSAMLERKKRKPVTKSVAPDDDPEFLRNLARKLDEEAKNDAREEKGTEPDDK